MRVSVKRKERPSDFAVRFVKLPDVVRKRKGRVSKFKVFGRAWLYRSENSKKATPTIDLNPNQSSKTLLNSAIHEALHLCYPDASESNVETSAGKIANVLWRLGFRQVLG